MEFIHRSGICYAENSRSDFSNRKNLLSPNTLNDEGPAVIGRNTGNAGLLMFRTFRNGNSDYETKERIEKATTS
jgi:hypothetical protein